MSNKKHDPEQYIKQQQKSLDIAIKQNEGKPELQEALRKQKTQLGTHLKPFKALSKATDGPKQDGGNVRRSQMMHAGDKASALMKNAISVKVINKRSDPGNDEVKNTDGENQ